jgi:hypothetical protein
MKKYTACLVDTALPYKHPYEKTNNQYEASANIYRVNEIQDSVFAVLGCKRRFGFIYDELTREDYGRTLGNISHLVTNVRWEGAQIWCDILVLDTKEGKLLESLLDAGMSFCLVYNFYNYCSGWTIDVRSIENPSEVPEEYILKRLETKEDFK